jgi:hypothetical protein
MKRSPTERQLKNYIKAYFNKDDDTNLRKAIKEIAESMVEYKRMIIGRDDYEKIINVCMEKIEYYESKSLRGKATPFFAYSFIAHIALCQLCQVRRKQKNESYTELKERYRQHLENKSKQ